MDTQLAEPTSIETLLGGAEKTVILNDGKTDQVKIAQIPVSAFPSLLMVIDDEPRMAEFYCEKPKGWGDTLSFESLGLVIEEGERINSDFFGQWLQRRINRQAKLLPGVAKQLSALQTGLPKLQSSAA